MWEGRKRGVIFDVGHGGGSFAVADRRAGDEGGLPARLDFDRSPHRQHERRHERHAQRDGQVPGDGHVARRCDAALDVESGDARSGTRNWAICRSGAVADIAVLRLEKGNFGFVDMYGARLNGTQKLTCELTLRDGKVVYDLNGMTRPDWNTLPKDYRQTGDARWDAITPAPVRQPR